MRTMRSSGPQPAVGGSFAFAASVTCFGNTRQEAVFTGNPDGCLHKAETPFGIE